MIPDGTPTLDAAQAASATQFDRQSDRYGRSHILADVSDISAMLDEVLVPAGGTALDVATGGGHTALWLARKGWDVTAGDIAPRMLENATRLVEEAGYVLQTKLFAAEVMPFGDALFDLVTVRVATHHFSDPPRFLREVARVLRSGGRFLLIDGSVPDHDPETEEWMHRVEKLRDPSHGRFNSPKAWAEMVVAAGLTVSKLESSRRKQPDLDWYFETAATTPEHRALVLDAVRSAPSEVRAALGLAEEAGKIVWWWPMVSLLAEKVG